MHFVIKIHSVNCFSYVFHQSQQVDDFDEESVHHHTRPKGCSLPQMSNSKFPQN